MSARAAPSDEVLLDRILDGDEEAFQTLFERHAGLLAGHARRLLPPNLMRKVSVADLMQEARLTAFQRRLDYDRTKGSFRNWLVGIVGMKVKETARHYAGTAKRAAGREVSRGRRVDTEQFAGRGPSPSEAAVAAERAALARQVRDALPSDQREVLRLVHEEGLSLREAAPRLDRSREATKKLYGRALVRFKQLFVRLEGSRHE